jgi:hypothetical protein
MRNTQVVLENYKTYKNKISVKYLSDGKLDANELDMLFTAIMTNQACLAMAIRDVYQATTRVERQLKQSMKSKSRGPMGF